MSKRAGGRAVSVMESSETACFSHSPFRIYFHGGWANGGEGGKIRRRPISVMIRYERTALIV